MTPLRILPPFLLIAATTAQDYISRGSIPTNYASYPGYFAADLDNNGSTT